MTITKPVYNTDELTLCDFCLEDITNKIQVRETEVMTFFLCSICSSIYDQHIQDEEAKNA